VQVARWFPSDVTLGHNYAWRSYFHGGPSDQSVEWRPAADQHLEKTQLSAAYHSDSSGRWVVAISSPIYKLDDQGNRQKFLGVVGVSFNVTKAFINVPQGSRQFAVLVDSRQGSHAGLILQHPLFTKLSKESSANFDRFENDPKYRVGHSELEDLKDGSVDYRDPIGKDDEAKTYNSRYLAAQYPIEVTEWEGKNAKTVPSGTSSQVCTKTEEGISGPACRTGCGDGSPDVQCSIRYPNTRPGSAPSAKTVTARF
jgi:hypothetical protein